MFERLICAVAGHRYVVQRVFSSTSRKVGCTRCDREWGMNDSVKAFVPWDGEFEQLYRDIGQWPGKTPNAAGKAPARQGRSPLTGLLGLGAEAKERKA